LSSADRPGEVLERGLAHDQVEGPRVERHIGDVFLPEVHRQPEFAGPVVGELHEGMADVQTGHQVRARDRGRDR